MAFEGEDFNSNLATAAGDDLVLLEELRAAFLSSLSTQLDLLGRARCDGNWEIAALRIKGLGISFHLPELVQLAEQAFSGAPGDPSVIRKLNSLYTRFTVLDVS